MSDSKSKLPPMPPSGGKPPVPSEIPTGPSPERKAMTAGWNDPPKNITSSQSTNPLRHGNFKYSHFVTNKKILSD